MSFRITGLPATEFADLFSLDDAALRKRKVNPKSITIVGAGEAYGDWLNILNQSQADRAVEIILSR